jgi:hypothetical protein
MPEDCPDWGNAMLAGVSMTVFGENRQDLADVNARRLSRLK